MDQAKWSMYHLQAGGPGEEQVSPTDRGTRRGGAGVTYRQGDQARSRYHLWAASVRRSELYLVYMRKLLHWADTDFEY